MPRAQNVIGALVASSLLISCAAPQINALDPRPRVKLSGNGHVEQLLLGAAIEDAFEIPTRGHAPTIRIQEWRTTLKRGFQYAFGTDHRDASDAPAIRIDRADLSFINTRLIDEKAGENTALLASADDDRLPVILAHGGPEPPRNPTIPVRSAYAEIKYSAMLLGANHHVVARSSGSVLSTLATSHSVSASEVVQNAVERLFEKMASDLFSRRPPASR